MKGEQHERAVEAIDPSGSAYGLSPLALGQIIERYVAALAEQGVVLVDLAEVADWVFEQHDDPDGGCALLADALERRFGGHERSTE